MSEIEESLRQLERDLGSLMPRADRIDRENLIFLAGQASVKPAAQRGKRLWQGAFAAMSGVAAMLLVMLVTEEGGAPAGISPSERTALKRAKQSSGLARVDSTFPGFITRTDRQDTSNSRILTPAASFEVVAALLAEGEGLSPRREGAVEAEVLQKQPPLTPIDWRSALEEAAPQRHFNNSTYQPYRTGVHS